MSDRVSDRAEAAYTQAVVVIPAHNEVKNLPRSLRAVLTAAAGAPVPVTTVVVLDSCSDDSTRLAGRYGPDVHFVSVDAGNVGAARAAGFTYARSLPGHHQDRAWYATTDADSRVDPDWLLRQLRAGADVVLGVVRVADWRSLSPSAIRRYLKDYHAGDAPDGGHDHIHGANMGFRADTYWQIGGFRALSSGEDVELVDRFDAAGYRIHRDAGLSVTTSARPQGRAPGGFAQHLRGLSSSARHSAVKDSA